MDTELYLAIQQKIGHATSLAAIEEILAQIRALPPSPDRSGLAEQGLMMRSILGGSDDVETNGSP